MHTSPPMEKFYITVNTTYMFLYYSLDVYTTMPMNLNSLSELKINGTDMIAQN